MAGPKRGLAQRINDALAVVAPQLALRREQANARRAMVRHYAPTGGGHRSKSFRRNSTDAVEAGRADREGLAFIARDMMRNNPRVVKGAKQIVNRVVGKGIVASVETDDADLKPQLDALIAGHWGTSDIDSDGVSTLTGQQSLVAETVSTAGEVLVRRRVRRSSDPLMLPYQTQVLEADYIDQRVDGRLSNGNLAIEGIEFDAIGKRVAYHLFAAHPGGRLGFGSQTRRVLAENVAHVFMIGRPGQQRGVSWIAPVMTLLHDIAAYQDGQVKRQEIASLFAAIYKHSDGAEELDKDFGELVAGGILNIGDDETLDFTDPPQVEGYEPFMRGTDRTIAGALGLTYEEFTGDYSNVNFSSARMGRIDTDPFIQRAQTHMMIPMFCQRQAGWFKEAAQDALGIAGDRYKINWTPPRRPLIDPTKEFAAAERARRAGLGSRRNFIREMGNDPDGVEAEILAEEAWAKDNNLTFSSHSGQPRKAKGDQND